MVKSVLSRIVIFIAALGLGFGISDTMGKNKLAAQRDVSLGKIRQIKKKSAFLKKQMAREKYEKFESIASLKRQILVSEKENKKGRFENRALRAKLNKLNEEISALRLRVNDADKSLAIRQAELKEMKELKESGENLNSKLNLVLADKRALETELGKMKEEIIVKKKLLDNTKGKVALCVSNNTDLALIAEDLVEKYRNKGFGSVFLDKEPLTGLKKVKLEKIVRQYNSEIEQKRVAN